MGAGCAVFFFFLLYTVVGMFLQLLYCYVEGFPTCLLADRESDGIDCLRAVFPS